MAQLAELTKKSETLSVTGRSWQLREPDAQLVGALSQISGISPVVAKLLAVRGVLPEEAPDFLNPTLRACLPDPAHLLDMDKAITRLSAAVIHKEQIAIFGDYDVDGATSSALLLRYFRTLGLEPLVHIPDRMKEGYGPNAHALQNLQERGAKLVITVDCGTLAFDAFAAVDGMDIIVLDHHQGEARRPKALAIVNPNRLDEDSPHKQLAAVGVTFLTLVALNRHLREAGYFQTMPEPDLRQWLDIVALGTICDVVPLVGVNRALVSQGLHMLAMRNNPGIRAVMNVAKLDEKPAVYHAGFVIGPRINAGGRVGKSDLGVRLLSSDDEDEVQSLAHELDAFNADRKAIEAQALEEALVMAEAAPKDSAALIVAGKGWHAGVIGIIAGRLKEKFKKPTAVIAIENGIGKASARSVSGMDFGAAVIAAMDAGLLVAGGGHAMAAGFTVEEKKIPALAEFLQKRFEPQRAALEQERKLVIDIALALSAAHPEQITEMEKLGPFGQNHFPIRVMFSQVVNLRPELVGTDHVKTMLIETGGKVRLSAIAFRCADSELGRALLATRGKEIDVAGQLRLQEWQGQPRVSFTIDDIRLCG